ncbi:MAG: hypothetical protein K6C34_00075 [Alphaproteobacteria bacterium]|nr:hypothetical protein [Alphaproteobacteria bacterium]
MKKYILACSAVILICTSCERESSDTDSTIKESKKWEDVENIGVDNLNEDAADDNSVLKTSDENADLARRQKEAREDDERIYKDDGYWSARENQQSKKTFDEAMPASKAIRGNIDKIQQEQKLGAK